MDNTIISLAIRNYERGKICLHTDRLNAFGTGHGLNTKSYWRKFFAFLTGKSVHDNISIGFVKINNYFNISDVPKIIDLQYQNILIQDLQFNKMPYVDCLYFVGVPDITTDHVQLVIQNYVRAGGCLVIENPYIEDGYINIIGNIENIRVTSGQPLSYINSYWSEFAIGHPLYEKDVKFSFMSIIYADSLSNYWDILASNVDPIYTTATTTSLGGDDFYLIGAANSHFCADFYNTFKNGVTEINCDEQSSSSSSSSSSFDEETSSSSSSSSFEYLWNVCSNIVAEWKMEDNTENSLIKNENKYQLYAIYKNNIGSAVATNLGSVAGKLNKALTFGDLNSGYMAETLYTKDLNFVNLSSDLDMSISFWMYVTNVGASGIYVLDKCNSSSRVWTVYINSGGRLIWRFHSDIDPTTKYRAISSVNGVITNNVWYHVVLTHSSGSGGTGADFATRAKMYVNGVAPSMSTPLASSTYTIKLDLYCPLIMGYSLTSGTKYPLEGYMDQLVIFDKVLSGDEILYLYNSYNGTEQCRGI